MAEGPRGSIGGALKETVSGRAEEPSPRGRVGALMFYNAARASIVQSLLREPALTASGVSRRSGVDPSSTAWHLRRLSEADVVERVDGGEGSFFTLRGLVQDRAALGDLRLCYRHGSAELLALVSRSPGLDIVEAAARLSATRGRVSRSVARLSARGLLAARSDGTRRRLFLSARPAELSDASRRWYRDYRQRLAARLQSEGLDVRVDPAPDRSTRLEYRAGGAVVVIVVPYRLSF